MLIPRSRLVNCRDSGKLQCGVKFSVYDTDKCEYIMNRVFDIYDTKEECQKEIDFYNSFSIVDVS